MWIRDADKDHELGAPGFIWVCIPLEFPLDQALKFLDEIVGSLGRILADSGRKPLPRLDPLYQRSVVRAIRVTKDVPCDL